jgi:hypothetical protein
MHRTAPLALLAALTAAAALSGPARAAAPCDSASAPAATADAAVEPVDQARAATLLFIPGPVRTPQPVLTADLQQLPGFAVGLFSPTLGRYSPTQMMLDVSQGARVASSLYNPVTPAPPGLVASPGGGGRLTPWATFTARAAAVPGDIVPGLLGCAVLRGGGHSSWTGFAGSPTITSIAVADTAGAIGRIGAPPVTVQTSRLLAAQRSDALVVAALPSGGPGFGIARRLAADQPARLVMIVQAPPEPARTRLLTLGVRGLGGSGGLRSATTRRDGLVAATDIAPTILARLGIPPPAQMQGRPIVAAPRLSAEQLNAMNDRLALVAGRRTPLARNMILLGGIVVILLLLAGRLTGRYDELSRVAQRVIGLGMLWIPFMLLVTAALRPSRATEVDIAIAGGLLLAFLTDRLVAWPRALAVPVFFVVLAHGLDLLLLDGRITGESMLGSNPLYGARFFGVGNELEAVISVSAVIGVGAALCDSGVRRPARWFAAAGLVLALFLGAGRIGADVGGVIFVAAAFGVAAAHVARVRPTPLRVVALILLPLFGLGLIALLDAVTGGESHLTRTVFEAGGPGDLLKVADRRLRASIEGARGGGVWFVMLLSIVALVWGWIRRDRLLAPLTRDGEDPASRRPLRSGMTGALAGTVIGALANDSGPAILIIGTIYICTGLLYVRGRPLPDVP